ncbi:MAG: DNA-directed RNA polymerase subunit alpha [Candidatus Riflebacteria bacterium]|nr:DNA-directed RNA polymerase subunit alpha [Candidatus Riflebacteria bacterium]
MIEINRPKIKFQMGDSPNHGILTLEPLEKGYGQTLGNSFRRVLLSSLPGSSVSAVQIDGVLHEFCSIPGVVEDVTEIILNLKKLVVNLHQDEPLTVRLEAKGPCQVTAGDIGENPNLTIIEPETHLAHITGDITLGMDITFTRGRGYKLAEQQKAANQNIGLILVDSQYSPVTKVMFNVEDARVGQDINFDKLTLQVWTNGSMKPVESIELAGKFLRAHIDLFLHLEDEEEVEGEEEEARPAAKEDLVMVASQKKEPQQKGYQEILIKDLEFSVRSRNCLKKAGIHTMGELVNKKASELLEIKNFGKKSLKEVREKLAQFNLTLPGDENGGGTEE